jgi:prolipoprotein diacylglyceryltransferase
MKENIITKALVLIIVVFIFSLVFALIDNGAGFSAYELGYATGRLVKYFLRNLGLLGLIVLTIEAFNKKR